MIGKKPIIENKEIKGMTKENVLALKKDRLNKLAGTPKNIKCGGVVRKLRRSIRNLEK